MPAAKQILRVTIDYDPDVESPCEYDGFKVVTFANHIYTTDEDPWKYLKDLAPTPRTVALRRKLDTGTAFWLSRFKHSGEQWGLIGEVHQDQWDTARVAGLLLWTDKPKDLGKDYAEREQRARNFMEVYTDWCNGWCYQYAIERLQLASEDVDDPDELDIDLDALGRRTEDVGGCGGLIGTEHLKSCLLDEFQGLNPDGLEIVLAGACKGLIDLDDLIAEPQHAKKS
jgi:hypothetical protein